MTEGGIFMKKRNWSFFCALVGLALLLTACAAPVQGEGRLLEFPKTSWEMTPEEVMAAYGVSQDAVTTSDSGEPSMVRRALSARAKVSYTAWRLIPASPAISPREKSWL